MDAVDLTPNYLSKSIKIEKQLDELEKKSS